jgi:hypothetical protein
MTDAPFTAANAAAALAPLAAVFIGIGGILMIMKAGRLPTGRALALGVLIAIFAGLSPLFFQ